MRSDDQAARTPDLSPDDRLRAVARLLAVALLRRRDRPVMAHEPPAEILSDSDRNDLE